MVTIKIDVPTEVGSPARVGQNIRRYFDDKDGKWYFSVSDVIGVLTDSTDARNYWKVLKNRLKKGQNELVTKCNQLKMKAKDGKYYLTDTADSETMIGIIESVPKASVEAFKVLVRDIEENILAQRRSPNQIELSQEKEADPLEYTIPVRIEEVKSEVKLLIDGYETYREIFIKAFVAGVEENNLHISVSSKKIIISGKREKTESISEDTPNYLCEELYWVNFSRIIILPHKVNPDQFEKNLEFGLLTIKLTKV